MVYVSETVYDTPDTSPTSPLVVAVAVEVAAAVDDADAVEDTAEDDAPLVAPELDAAALEEAAPELTADEEAALDAAPEEAAEEAGAEEATALLEAAPLDAAAEEAATLDAAAEEAATLDAAGEETATEDAAAEDAYALEASTEDWPETATKRIAARAASLALRRTAIPDDGPHRLWLGVLRVLGNCSGGAASFMAQAGHVSAGFPAAACRRPVASLP